MREPEGGLTLGAELRTAAQSNFLEIEVFASEAKVIDDVGNYAARNIARVPSKGNEPFGMKGIRIVPVAAGGADQLAAKFAQPAIQLPAIQRRLFAHIRPSKRICRERAVEWGGRTREVPQDGLWLILESAERLCCDPVRGRDNPAESTTERPTRHPRRGALEFLKLGQSS